MSTFHLDLSRLTIDQLAMLHHALLDECAARGFTLVSDMERSSVNVIRGTVVIGTVHLSTEDRR